MKKLIALCMIAALFAACKKKKEADPEPPAPTPLPPSISVKIDGVEKQCNACYSGSKSGSLRSSYFYLSGFNEQIYISYPSTLPAAGSHNLVKFQYPMIIYIKDNTYYRAVSGTFNITSIDTSGSGVVNKLAATFNFKTDTTAGVSFNVTDGAINLK